MGIGTCDPASRGDAYNTVILEERLPDGSGYILTEVHYGWDGVSQRPDCDGPVEYLRTRNTGNMTAWALLPNKKRGNKWVQIDPQTDLPPVTSKGTLQNLGLSNYTDAQGVGFAYTQPA